MNRRRYPGQIQSENEDLNRIAKLAGLDKNINESAGNSVDNVIEALDRVIMNSNEKEMLGHAFNNWIRTHPRTFSDVMKQGGFASRFLSIILESLSQYVDSDEIRNVLRDHGHSINRYERIGRSPTPW